MRSKYFNDYDRIANRVIEKVGGFEEYRAHDAQVFVLAEEVGEFIQEWRRYTRRARTEGTLVRLFEELADVIISAEVFAALEGVDLDSCVAAKLEAIVERGGI